MHGPPVTPLDPAVGRTFDGARILVSGGGGFIATHLVNALARCGARLTVVDPRPMPLLDHLDGRVERHEISVGDQAFDRLLRSSMPFDYIFHLGARAYAADSVDAPVLDFHANLMATLQLLEGLRTQRSAARLVFASTAAVYGNPVRLPVREDDLTVPISPYGVSKLAAERYVAVYARLYGFPAASVRLFSVYGPGQTKQVVYDLLHKLHRTPHQLVVLGDGTQVRDLVYVDDVVRAFLVVAARGKTDGTAYNVASGSGASTRELAEMIVEAQGLHASITFTGRTRPGDPEQWVGDNRLLAAIGGQPTWSLRDGLRATANWLNSIAGPARLEIPV